MSGRAEQIRLPISTSSTSQGPLITVDPRVVVRYDGWHGDHHVWVRIEFIGAQSLEFRREHCCSADDIIRFGEMLCMRESPWLDEVLRRKQERLGEQFNERDADLAHYKVYFDHSGVVEVVARSVEISGPFNERPDA